MTSRHTANGEDQSTPRAMLANGRGCVFGTGGFEPAGTAGERRKQQLISANGDQGDAHARGHHLPRTTKLQQRGEKIRLHGIERRAHEIRLRDGDHVQAAFTGFAFRAAEHFAQSPLRAIPLHGATDAARRNDPHAIARTVGRLADEHEETPRDAAAAGIHGLVLRAMPNPGVRAEPLSHGRAPGVSAWKRSGASGPWRGGA